MDLNKLRTVAVLGKATSTALLGAHVGNTMGKIVSLSPEAIADGASQEKRDFLAKLRTISANGEGTPIEKSE